MICVCSHLIEKQFFSSREFNVSRHNDKYVKKRFFLSVRENVRDQKKKKRLFSVNHTIYLAQPKIQNSINIARGSRVANIFGNHVRLESRGAINAKKLEILLV